MKSRSRRLFSLLVALLLLLLLGATPRGAMAAEKLVGIYSAQVMSQSLPAVAEAAGLFRKHGIDFHLVYISSSGMVTAAMLSGDAEISLTGGVGNVRAYVQGATDLVFIGAVKNVMTQSLMGKPEIKKPEELKGKKVGVTRIGSNTHYFAVQALRRFGLDPGRDVTFIQTGGEPQALAALTSGSVDAISVTSPTDAKAVALGYPFVVYGPDLRIPYTATAFVGRRSVIAKRPQVIGQFMRAMAEALKIMHMDREFTYKVLAKEFRVKERSVLDAAYNAEIKALETKLAIKPEALQAILDEVAPVDPRAKNVKPQELVDSRYLEEMAKSGFFDQIWAGKK